MDAPALDDVLSEAQRLGFLGDRPIPEVIAHARRFVDALHDVEGTVLDLGSGGGVPGLVIAHDRPDLTVALLDRRTKRTDFLQRMVGRLGWGDRVHVVANDAESAIATAAGTFDAVVARGFGPPEHTLSVATAFVAIGGPIVVSEPPAGDRWDPAWLERYGLERTVAHDEAHAAVVVFRRRR